ncbi:MAG: hypothetical protein ACJA2S_004681 [Cyclobacteriaceae bacterium]|jgi:uncharacterized protein (DUF58 family)
MRSLFNSLFITTRFFQTAGALVILMVLGFVWPGLFSVAIVLFFVLIIILLLEIYLLVNNEGSLKGRRVCSEMFSNGSENSVRIYIENHYNISLNISILEEAPEQFQMRNLNFQFSALAGDNKVIDYHLTPTERGEYKFGSINAFAYAKLGLASRRFKLAGGQVVKVYPSIAEMKKADLMLFSKSHLMQGIKKIRRAGQNTEFEEIKEYSAGDEFRRINWKASARKNDLMVNVFQEEKSRPVYSVINKGRTMYMPFNGLSLFDHAVNASLALSNVILKKSDKAGLITFEKSVSTFLKADSKMTQLKRILEFLYKEKTNYQEPNYYDLYSAIRSNLSHRSLLMIYTNFESYSSLEHQLPIFKKLNKSHVVLIVFFENTELRQLIDKQADSLQDIYHLSVAQKFDMEKRIIQRELLKNGIQSVLTKPESLTVDTINKYLEIKSRGLL